MDLCEISTVGRLVDSSICQVLNLYFRKGTICNYNQQPTTFATTPEAIAILQPTFLTTAYVTHRFDLRLAIYGIRIRQCEMLRLLVKNFQTAILKATRVVCLLKYETRYR